MKMVRLPIAALALWAVPAATAWAQLQGGESGGYGYSYGHHPHMWGGEWGWGGMFLGPVFGILFIAVIAVAIVLVVRALGGGSAGRSKRSAHDILDERFARGEIDHEEYEERKRVLRGD